MKLVSRECTQCALCIYKPLRLFLDLNDFLTLIFDAGFPQCPKLAPRAQARLHQRRAIVLKSSDRVWKHRLTNLFVLPGSKA